MLGPVSLICVGVSAGADRGSVLYVQGSDCGDYNSGSAGSARVREGVVVVVEMLEARAMAAMVVTSGMVEAGEGG